MAPFLSVSLLAGFLGGLCIQASTIFFHPERRLRYGYFFAISSSGVIWGLMFAALSLIYSSEGMLSEERIKGLMIGLGVTLTLASVAFDLCYAAVRKMQPNHNQESSGSDPNSD